MSDPSNPIVLSSGEEDFYIEQTTNPVKSEDCKRENTYVLSDNDDAVSSNNDTVSSSNENNVNESFEDAEIDAGYMSPPDEDVKYYKNNKNIPIFKITSDIEYSPQTLIDLLVSRKSARVATKKPVKVQDNFTFIIDTKKLKSPNDWAADDNGCWENRGNYGTIVSLDENMKIVHSSRMNNKKRTALKSGELLIYKVYYRNKAYHDYKRNSYVIKTQDDKTLDLVLVEYRYIGEVRPIIPKPHGLAKKNKKPFTPTAESHQTQD
uniref:Uncharacterized protein n=2 Tax=Clytia hemisphaerica TaxID=252671 RepID=A0A7M5X687_9CNID